MDNSKCSIIHDETTKSRKQVLAPNGKPSLLYQSAKDFFEQDERAALRAWSIAYTNKFMQRHGDWRNGVTTLRLDDNGEPLLENILYLPSEINKIIKQQFYNWHEFHPGEDPWQPEAKVLRFKAAFQKRFPDVKIDLERNYSLPGMARIKFLPSYKNQGPIKYSKKEIELQKQKINPIMDYLVGKFKGLSYQWINPNELNQNNHYEPISSIRAYVRNNKIILVEGRVIPEDAIEEVMHVFVEVLRRDRPALFTGLFNAFKDDPRFAAEILNLRRHYSTKGLSNPETIVKHEFISKNLATAMKAELEQAPEGRKQSALGKLIERFFEWLSELLQTNTLFPETKLATIAQMINTDGMVFNAPEVDPYMYYSTDNVEGADFNPEDREDLDRASPRNKKKTAKEMNLEKAQSELVALQKTRDLLSGVTPSTPKGSTLAKNKYKEVLKVIDTLEENVKYKIGLLEQNVLTIGVTKYIGSEDTQILNDFTTKLGANFGNFFHYMVEELQNEYAKGGVKPNITLSTTDFFDKFYAKNKDLIMFKDYDVNVLRNAAIEIATSMSNLLSENKVLLPEISVVQQDLNGNYVLGRFDILAVDLKGNIEIVDLKTKKTDGNVGNLDVFPMDTFRKMDTFKGNYKPGANILFSDIRARNALTKYHMQLAVYSEMLRRLNLNVNGRTVWALAYKYIGDPKKPETVQLAGYKYSKFNELDIMGHGQGYDPANQPVHSNEVEMAARNSFRFQDDISDDTSVPSDPKNADNPFAHMSEDVQKIILDRLDELAKEQYESLEREKQNIRQNKQIEEERRTEMVDAITKRQSSIIAVRTNIKSSGLADSKFSKANLIRLALDVMISEINYMKEKIREIDIPETYQLNSKENNEALSSLQSYMKNLSSMANTMEMFKNSIRAVTTLEENIKEDILNYLSKIEIQIVNISDVYYRTSRDVIKAIIKETQGGLASAGVFGQMKAILEPQLKFLENQIAKIKNGTANDTSMGWKAMRFLKGIVGIESVGAQTTLEEYERKAAEIRKMIELNELNDDTIDMYLNGVFNNSDHPFYLGSTTGTVNGFLNADDFIGANANSELIISAMWKYMFTMKERGRTEFLKWADSLGIDKFKENFINSMGGLANANNFIVEEVDVPIGYDKDGNVTETKRIRRFVDPVSQEFYETYNSYTVSLKNLNERIDEINAEISNGGEDVVLDKLRQNRDALRTELAQKRKDFVLWKIAETNTILKPEVLMLQMGSGVDIAEITELQETISAIIRSAGSDAYLTDLQQDQIDNLESEISRILYDMRQKNPEAMDVYKKLQEYYTFRPNWNLWQKKLSALEAEGNPAAIERFHQNNSDYVPTEEWNEQISKIYEKLAELGTQDEELKEINQEMSKLRSKAFVRGKFNYKYLNEEEILRYEELELQRERRKDELREENEDAEFDPDIQARKNALFTQLKTLRKEVLRSDFAKDYKEKRMQVVRLYNNLQQMYRERDQKESVDRAFLDKILDEENQYNRHIDEFITFFNKHSRVKFSGDRDSIAKGMALNEQWGQHLYHFIPANEKDMELVPNKKYRIKVLKDNAYNPDYQESYTKNRFSRGNYPMPKGIRLNPDTNMFEISKDAKYANPKFKAILGNNTASEFYSKWVVEQYLMKQKNASGTPLGFSLPFVQQLGFDNLVSKGMEGAVREMKSKVDELSYAGSELEKASNESGLMGENRILFKENYEVSADLTTTNGIEAIVNWNAGYYLNLQMAQLNVVMGSSIDWLKEEQRKMTARGTDEATLYAGKLQTIINQIEFNKNKFVFGQIYEKGYEVEQQQSVINRKNLRILTSVAAFSRMAFDVGLQAGNLISGNIQQYLSLSSTRHATEGDYLKAKKEFYMRFMPSMMRDWGKISDAGFETKLIRFLNPLTKNLDRMMDANTAGKMRRLANRTFNVGDLSMMIQDKGEVEIGVTTALMILINRRYEVFETDAEGNPIIENGVKKIKKDASGNNVYINGIDAFKLENNSIAIRKDVNLSMKEVEDLKVLIMTEIYRFQGNYSTDTRTRFGSTLPGTLFEFYRKYLIPALSARFQGALGDTYRGVGSSFGWATNEAYMGWWTATAKMVRYYGFFKAAKSFIVDGIASFPGIASLGGGRLSKGIRETFKTGIEPSDAYRSRASMAARELIMGYLALQLYYVLRAALWEKDDDEELTWTELQLYRALVKATNETRSMIPVPHVGKPQDYITTFGQFTTAFKEGETIINLANNAYYFTDYSLTGDEKSYELGYYKQNTIYFEEGDPKVLKNLYDLLGISNVIDTFDPEPRAKEMTKPKK